MANSKKEMPIKLLIPCFLSGVSFHLALIKKPVFNPWPLSIIFYSYPTPYWISRIFTDSLLQSRDQVHFWHWLQWTLVSDLRVLLLLSWHCLLRHLFFLRFIRHRLLVKLWLVGRSKSKDFLAKTRLDSLTPITLTRCLSHSHLAIRPQWNQIWGDSRLGFLEQLPLYTRYSQGK